MRDSSIEFHGAGTGEINLNSGKGFSLAAFLFFGEKVRFLMITGLVRKLEPCSLGEICFALGSILGCGSVPTVAFGFLLPLANTF